MFTPKTASEAARLALLTERAESLLREGYQFSEDTDTDTVAVCKPGQLSAAYFLMDGKCCCPAREKERTCKHEIAWYLLQAQRAADEAQAAEYDARMRRLRPVLKQKRGLGKR